MGVVSLTFIMFFGHSGRSLELFLLVEEGFDRDDVVDGHRFPTCPDWRKTSMEEGVCSVMAKHRVRVSWRLDVIS